MSVLAKSVFAVLLSLPLSLSAFSDPLPPDLTYRPLPTLPFSRVKAADEAQKAAVMQRQSGLLNERYDLSDRAMQNVMMSGGRKPVFSKRAGSTKYRKAEIARPPSLCLADRSSANDFRPRPDPFFGTRIGGTHVRLARTAS
jgi:hypothetical protein